MCLRDGELGASEERFRRLAKMLAQLYHFEFQATIEALKDAYADIDPENAGSIKLVERLGFKYEGRLRGAWKTHIGVRDTLIYGMLAQDLAT